MIAIDHLPSQELRQVTGCVTEIERYAIHDGLGIRSTVFLKGCPLRCRWCSNPETQRLCPELGMFADKCIGCGACMAACPYGAIRKDETGALVTNRQLCQSRCYGNTDTYPCCGVCYTGARKMIGETRTAWEVCQQIARDRRFYDSSNGGMTLSGGEPLSQPDFAYAVLRLCKENWISTAIETCGAGELADYERLLPWLDMLFIDVKGMNRERYQAWVGAEPDHQMNVARSLAQACNERGISMVVRTPIIPGFNDAPEDVEQIASFLGEIRAQGAELLPYHRLGRSKYAAIGREYSMMDATAPDDETMIRLNQILESHGIPVLHY